MKLKYLNVIISQMKVRRKRRFIGYMKEGKYGRVVHGMWKM